MPAAASIAVSTETNPVFLEELIQVGLACVHMHDHNNNEITARKKMLDILHHSIETQLQYSAFTIKKTKDEYKDLKAQLIAAEAKLKEVYEEYVKVFSLDSNREKFYHEFLEHLYAIGQASCNFYYLAKLSFIECVEIDLNTATRHLENMHKSMFKVREEPTHANKDVLVDTYQEATDDFAKLAESTSRKAIQPTTNPELAKTLHGYFEKVNELNDQLAETINVVLQAPAAKAKEVFPPAQEAYYALEHAVRDLSIIITEERLRLSKIDLFPMFLQAIKEAQEAGELEREQYEDDGDKESGHAGKLNEYAKAKGLAVTPAQQKLAEQGDALDKALENVTRSVNDENAPLTVTEAVDQVGPALDGLPKTVDALLQDQLKANEAAADLARERLQKRQKELEAIKKDVEEDTKNGKPTPEALQKRDDAYKQVASKALADVDPDKNPFLFGDDETGNLRKHLDDKAKNGGLGPNPNDPTASAKNLKGDLDDTHQKLGEYLKGLDPRLQADKNAAKDMKKEIEAAVNDLKKDLDKGAKDLEAQQKLGESANPIEKEKARDNLLDAVDRTAALNENVMSLLPAEAARRADEAEARDSVQAKSSDLAKAHPTNAAIKPAASASSQLARDPSKDQYRRDAAQAALAEAADEASKAIEHLERTVDEPKPEIKRVKSAAGRVRRPVDETGDAAAMVLMTEPSKINQALEKVKKNLNEDQDKMKELQKELDQLKKQADAAPKDKPIDPALQKKLEDAQDKLDEVLQKTSNDLKPDDNRNLLGTREPEAVRNDLNNSLDDLRNRQSKPPQINKNAAEEVQRLQEQLASAQDSIEKLPESLQNAAGNSSDLAKELASAYPAALREAERDLEDAVQDAQRKGLNDETKGNIEQAANRLDNLVDLGKGLGDNAAAPVSLKQLRDQLGGPNGSRDGAAGTAVRGSAVAGNAPTANSFDGADGTYSSARPLSQRAAEKAKTKDNDNWGLSPAQLALMKAVADTNQAVGNADAALKNKDDLAAKTGQVAPAVNNLNNKVADVMDEEKARINKDAEDTKNKLAEQQKKLDDLSQQLGGLTGPAADSNSPKVKEGRDKLQDIIAETNKLVSVAKNPNLFNNPDAARLRQNLNKEATVLEQPAAQYIPAADLKNDVDDLRDQLKDYKNTIDPTAKEAALLADELKEDFNNALKEEKDDVNAARDRLLAKGDSPARSEALAGVLNETGDLNEVAAALIPPKDTRAADLPDVQNRLNAALAKKRNYDDDPTEQAPLAAAEKSRAPELENAALTASEALKRIRRKLEDPKQPGKAIADETKNAQTPVEKLADKTKEYLDGVPKTTNDAAKKTDDQLKQRQKDLADERPRLDELSKAADKPNADLDQLQQQLAKEEAQVKKALEKALADISRDQNPGIYPAPAGNKAAIDLQDKIDDLNDKAENSPPSTAAAIKERADDLKDKVEEAAAKLDNYKAAQDQLVKDRLGDAERLKAELPKGLKDAMKDLLDSTGKADPAKHPQGAPREQVERDLQKLERLVAAAEGLGKDNDHDDGELGGVRNDLQRGDKQKNKPDFVSNQLEELQKKDPETVITPEAKELAVAIDDVQRGLKEASNILVDPGKPKTNLKRTVNFMHDPMGKISDSVKAVVNQQKAQMHDAAAKTKDKLKSHQNELSGINDDIKKLQNDIAKAADGRPNEPDNGLADRLAQQQDRAKALADRALDDLRKEEQPNVLGSDAAREVREQLLATSHAAEEKPNKETPAKTLADAAKELQEEIAKTQDKLAAYPAKQDAFVAEQDKAADYIAEQLPKGFKDADSTLSKETDNAINGKPENFKNELNQTQALTDAAAALLPSEQAAHPDFTAARRIFTDLPAVAVLLDHDVPSRRRTITVHKNTPRQLEDPANAQQANIAPSQLLQDIEKNVEKAQKGIRGVNIAVADDEKPPAATVPNEVIEPMNLIAKAAEEVLRNEPPNLAKQADETKAALEDRQKELRELGNRLDGLGNALDQAPPGKTPEALNKQIADAEKDLNKTAEKALASVARAKDPNLLGTPASENLRRELKNKIGGNVVSDDKDKPIPKAKQEIDDLKRQVKDAQDDLQDFTKGLDGSADRLSDEANGLKDDLPKALRDKSKDLSKASDDYIKDGPAGGRKERLQKAAKDADQVVNAAAGLLPKNSNRPPIEETRSRLSDVISSKPPNFRPPKDTAASKMDAALRARGLPPTAEQKELAEDVDRANEALKEIDDAKTPAELDKAVKKLAGALARLPETTAAALKKKPEDLKRAWERLKKKEDEAKEELDKLKQILDQIRKNREGKKDQPLDDDTKQKLGDLRKRFKDVAGNLRDNLAASKEPDLFGNVKSEKLRNHLAKGADWAKPKDAVPSDIDDLIKAIDDTKAKIDDHSKAVDDKLAEDTKLAEQLSKDLPKAIAKSNDDVLVAAADLAAKPDDPKAQREFDNAVAKANDLVQASGDVLPTTDPVPHSLEDIEGVVVESEKLPREPDFTAPGQRRAHTKPAVERLAEKARETGVPPSAILADLAKKADKADQALEGVYGARSSGGLAKAVNNAKPTILALAEAVGKVMENDANNLKPLADDTVKELKKDEDQLAKIESELEKLKQDAAKHSGATGEPDPKDIEKLEKLRDDFLKTADKALDDVALEKSPYLFSGPKAEQTRGQLNKDLANADDHKGVPIDTPMEMDKEIKQLLDQTHASKLALTDFAKTLPDTAARNESMVKKMASAMPAVGGKVNDTFVVAAADVVTKGPEDGRDEKLLNQLDNVAALIDTADWALPPDNNKPDLEQMQKHLRQLVAEPSTTIPEKTAEERLADHARKQGILPTEDQVKLADAVDRSVAALDNVAVASENNAPPGKLQEAVENALPPISDTAAAAAAVLSQEPKRLEKAAEKAQRRLKDRQNELAELADAIKPFKAKKKLSPAEEKQLDELKDRFRKFASRAQQDISPNRDPSLFDNLKSEKLRRFLQGLKDQLDPTKASKDPAKDAEDLAKAIADAQKQLDDYVEALPEETNKTKRLAEDMAQQLPQALRDAAAEMTLAAKDVANKGRGDGRGQKLASAINNAAALVDTSAGILPSSKSPASLNDIKKATEGHRADPDAKPAPEAARKLEDYQRATNEPITEAQKKIADAVDKTASALQDMDVAMKDEVLNEGLAGALDKAEPAVAELASNVADVLQQEADKIDEDAKHADKALEKAVKDLAKLAEEMQGLQTKWNKNPTALPPANELKQMKAANDKLNKIIDNIKEEIDPAKNPNIFADAPTDRLREILQRQQDKPAPGNPTNAKEAADQLQDLLNDINDTKDNTNEYRDNLAENADDLSQAARELATELPSAIRDSYSRVVKSSRGVMMEGPDEQLRERLNKAHNIMADLVQKTAGLLPSSNKRADIRGVLKKLRKDGHAEEKPEGSTARALYQYGKDNGITISRNDMELAEATDVIDRIMEEIALAVSPKGHLSGLRHTLVALAPAVNIVTKNIPPALTTKTQQVQRSGDASKRALQQAAKDLKPSTDGPFGPLFIKGSGKLMEHLRSKQNQEVLTGNNTRQIAPLLELGQESEENAVKAAAQLQELLPYAEAEVDKAVQENEAVAKELSSELPSSIKNAHAAIVDAATEILQKGLTSDRRDKLLAACDQLSVLTDAAGQIPAGSLRNANVAVQDAAETDDKSDPIVDSVKQLYSSVLRTPTAREPPSQVPKSELQQQIAEKRLSKLQTAPVPAIPKGSFRGKVGWSSKIRDAVKTIEVINRDGPAARPKLMDLVEGEQDRSVKESRRKSKPHHIWNEIGTLKFEPREKNSASKSLLPKSGNVNHLVTYLTQPLDGDPSLEDAEFVRAIFNSLDSVVKPEVFVNKLIERYEGPPKDNISEYEKNILSLVQKRVCTVFKQYIIARHLQDFPSNPDLVQKCKDFAQLVTKDSDYLGKDLELCLKLYTTSETFQNVAAIAQGKKPWRENQEAGEIVPFQKTAVYFNAQDVARQLTAVDSEIFKAIRLNELANASWTAPDAAKKAPNVLEYIEQTQKVSRWVAFIILQEPDDRRQRKIFANMISLGQHLVLINNFHSATAVVAALQSLPVQKLPFASEYADSLQKLVESLAEKKTSKGLAGAPVVPFAVDFLAPLADNVAAHNDANAANPPIDWKVQMTAATEMSTILEQQRVCQYRFPVQPRLRQSIQQSIAEAQGARLGGPTQKQGNGAGLTAMLDRVKAQRKAT